MGTLFEIVIISDYLDMYSVTKAMVPKYHQTSESDNQNLGKCVLCNLPSDFDFCPYCTIRPLPRVTPSVNGWPPSSAELETLYNSAAMSVHDIAKATGRRYGTINYWMRKYGLARRSREEASRMVTRKYPIREFTGDLVEKAYLFGISLGDLHVGKLHKSIVIYTSTSVQSMVDLIVDSFSKYARASITPTVYLVKGKKIGGWRVRAVLSLSFSFLLEKYSNCIPAWVLETEAAWRSFLGGIFDAEGQVGIYDSKGHRGGSTMEVRIVNTNSELIHWLHSQLSARGFHPRIQAERNAVSAWYTLILGRRAEIQLFLSTIPFRHPKKKDVARLLLRIPPRIDAVMSSAIVREYKVKKRQMKENDRREGRVSILAMENRGRAKPGGSSSK